MMATVHPEQIQYYGAKYDGAPVLKKTTNRIQEKVRMYYANHQTEIKEYDTETRLYSILITPFTHTIQYRNQRFSTFC